MDRRDFVKSFMAPVALAPLLLGLRSGRSAEDRADAFYLLSDRPQAYLPLLLDDMSLRGMFRGRTIALGIHPQAGEIRAALRSWTIVPDGEPADVQLRFVALGEPQRPSFTLVSGSRLVDLRRGSWAKLWRDMEGEGRTRGMTLAAFTSRGETADRPGSMARVSIDGRILDHVSLKDSGLRTYSGPLGRLRIRIEGGSLRMEHADCRHHICVKTPPASRSGDRIVCAPNRFLAEVEGRRFWDTIIG